MAPKHSDENKNQYLRSYEAIGGISANRIQQMMKYNIHSRGVEEYSQIATETLFPPESYQDNIIISGSETGARQKFCERIIYNCAANKRPMIILHLANKRLENCIIRNNYGTVINEDNRQLDVFTSFKLQDICNIVLNTCKTKYDIKPAGRYILHVVYKFLECRRLRPYFFNYANFTYQKIPARINDSLARGLITSGEAEELAELYESGKSECAKIDAFFNDMKDCLSPISSENDRITHKTSIFTAINKRSVLAIDILSSTNDMLIEMLANSLKIAMNRGVAFTLCLDEITIANNDALKTIVCQKSSHNNVICSNDLYSLLYGKDDLFATIVGASDKTLLLSHGSHISCEKWSEYLGEYSKINMMHKIPGAWASEKRAEKMGGVETREFKINPEMINRLQYDEIIMYDNNTGSLIQANML